MPIVRPKSVFKIQYGEAMSLSGLDGLTGAWVRAYSQQHDTPQ